MIERDHPNLSVGRQCRLLSLSRSSFYYRLAGETELNLDCSASTMMSAGVNQVGRL